MTEKELEAVAEVLCGEGGRWSPPGRDDEGRYALFVTPETLRELAGLREALAHYRGTCDRCGREGVLLDTEMEAEPYESGYLVGYCWVDPVECARIVEERWHPEREKHRAAALKGWETRRQRA